MPSTIKASDQLEMAFRCFPSLSVHAVHFYTNIFWCNIEELFLEQICAKRTANSSASPAMKQRLTQASETAECLSNMTTSVP